MPVVTYRASELRLSIAQGVAFHRELELAYSRYVFDAAGEPVPFDFTDWTARLNLVDEKGNIIVEFATTGENGVITLGTEGQIDLDLADEHTTTLPATVEIAGVIHAVLYGDLILTSPEAVPFQAARVVAEITRTTAA